MRKTSDWKNLRKNKAMYRTFHDHCREKFGTKVYKLSIDAGFSCPNRDGTCGEGGCIFCDGSGAFAGKGTSVTAQLEQAKLRVQAKNTSGKYIAYFQAFTNTYAPVEQLRKLYLEAIAGDEIVGLAIGTRPDCLGDEVIGLLKEINGIKPVSVELGLQTTNPNSVRYIRRGYDTQVYFDAVARLKAAGIDVVTHIILGLPEETPEDAVKTTLDAVAAGTDGVKFHLLHVLRGTDLAADYEAGKFRCLTLEEYGHWLTSCIALLPPHITVHRITGDGAKRDLIAPAWSADKKRVLNYLNQTLRKAGLA